jgi:hypothetical protein
MVGLDAANLSAAVERFGRGAKAERIERADDMRRRCPVIVQRSPAV